MTANDVVKPLQSSTLAGECVQNRIDVRRGARGPDHHLTAQGVTAVQQLLDMWSHMNDSAARRDEGLVNVQHDAKRMVARERRGRHHGVA